MNNIIEALNWRYACKQFDPNKKISDKDFDTILESLRLTASSYGLQPWKFVVVENKELRSALVGASWNQKQVEDASHLIVMCVPTQIDETFVDSYLEDTALTRGQAVEELVGFKKMLMMVANKSEADKFIWAKSQSYIALGNLLSTCAQMRIDSCPMEGFQPKKYDEILGLTEMGLTSVLVCPVGYRDEADKYIGNKKVRFTRDKLVVKL